MYKRRFVVCESVRVCVSNNTVNQDFQANGKAGSMNERRAVMTADVWYVDRTCRVILVSVTYLMWRKKILRSRVVQSPSCSRLLLFSGTSAVRMYVQSVFI